MTRESDIESYLVQSVINRGGEIRKVKWIARRGAPDRRVMLLETAVPEFSPTGFLVRWKMRAARSLWVELKAPGKDVEAHQQREHDRMRLYGEEVVVIDSYEAVDALFK